MSVELPLGPMHVRGAGMRAQNSHCCPRAPHVASITEKDSALRPQRLHDGAVDDDAAAGGVCVAPPALQAAGSVQVSFHEHTCSSSCMRTRTWYRAGSSHIAALL